MLLGGYYCKGERRVKYKAQQKQRIFQQIKARPILEIIDWNAAVSSGEHSSPLNKRYRWVWALSKFSNEVDSISIRRNFIAYFDDGDWYFTPTDRDFYNLEAVRQSPNGR